MAFCSVHDPIIQLLLAPLCVVILLHVYYDGGLLSLLVDLVSFVLDVRLDCSNDTSVPFVDVGFCRLLIP